MSLSRGIYRRTLLSPFKMYPHARRSRSGFKSTAMLCQLSECNVKHLLMEMECRLVWFWQTAPSNQLKHRDIKKHATAAR